MSNSPKKMAIRQVENLTTLADRIMKDDTWNDYSRADELCKIAIATGKLLEATWGIIDGCYGSEVEEGRAEHEKKQENGHCKDTDRASASERNL